MFHSPLLFSGYTDDALVDYDEYFYDYSDDDDASDASDAGPVGSLADGGEVSHWLLVRACEVVSDGLKVFMGRGLPCYGLREIAFIGTQDRERTVLSA